jgi:hypothetical protein
MIKGSKTWPRSVAQHWRFVRGACCICGGPIDYDQTWVGGKINTNGLAIIRVVKAKDARSKGWTETKINSLSNSAPSHKRCANGTGAKISNAKLDQSQVMQMHQVARTKWC